MNNLFPLDPEICINCKNYYRYTLDNKVYYECMTGLSFKLRYNKEFNCNTWYKLERLPCPFKKQLEIKYHKNRLKKLLKNKRYGKEI